MGLYDQNNQSAPAPWYAPQLQQTQPKYNTNQPAINQFIWVTSPSTVEMWPVAAGSEMTFIDNENMKLYVKRVDEFGHPFKTRLFDLIERTGETDQEKSASPAVNMDELKAYLSGEVDKAVSAKLKDMFTVKTESGVGNV